MTRVTCVTDNCVRPGSTFWGEHGVSFLIETDAGCILFDTGQSPEVLAHNLRQLGDSFPPVQALALSHAHEDHTGGLRWALNAWPGLPVYANADLFRPRYYRGQAGQLRYVGLNTSQDELRHAASLHLSRQPVQLLPTLWTTGEIQERSELPGGSPRLLVPDGDGWRQDAYQDDMSLVLKTGAGWVLICGCCHAGLLNTLAHVRRVFGTPIISVLGGAHLLDLDDPQLAHIVEVLGRDYPDTTWHLNHCTGHRALMTLQRAFGERVRPCPAATQLTFD